MNTINASFLPFFTILLLIPNIILSQSSVNLDSARTIRMNAAKEIMNSTKTCALITLDEEGKPSARAMEPFPPDSNFVVWFGTNTKSRKISHIKRDPSVTLYYLAKNGSGYVVIQGSTVIVDDPKEKNKRWKPAWEKLYANKNDEFILIKVIPESMEVFSFQHGLKGDPITWDVPKVIFD